MNTIAGTARRTSFILFSSFLVSFLAGCGESGPRVEVAEDPIARDWAQIEARDTLVALTQLNSTGYFLYRGEPMGFEYDLLRGFAEAHDLEFRAEVLEDREQLINRLNRGEGDVGAARLSPSAIESEHVAFTMPLYRTRATVVQRTGAAQENVPEVVDSMLDSVPRALGGREEPIEIRARGVRSPEDLAGEEVVIAGSPALDERLIEIEDSVSGDIRVVELEGNVRTEGVLRRVADGRATLAAAPENIAALSSEYYENITVRPTLARFDNYREMVVGREDADADAEAAAWSHAADAASRPDRSIAARQRKHVHSCESTPNKLLGADLRPPSPIPGGRRSHPAG